MAERNRGERKTTTHSPALTDHDAWVFSRIMSDQPINGEMAAVSRSWKELAELLAATPSDERQDGLRWALVGRFDRDAFLGAVALHDPNGPAPTEEQPRFATCADILRLETTEPWTWKGWLPSARVVGIAAGEGVGKTRLAMDLARRAWHGLPWPDGQPMTLPPKSPTVWVAADGQQTELAQSLSKMDMPPESIIFPTGPDDPFGGVSLDEEETVKTLDDAVRIHKPAFVIVDSLTYATRSDVGEQRAIASLKGPLVTLAQTHQVIVMLLLHLNREGQALGRRIRGITRTLMHLECPDPSQSRRLRLWVEKSYAEKPEELGLTIGESGNTYDRTPPKSGESSKAGRPASEREKAVKFIVAGLSKENDLIANDMRADWEKRHQGKRNTFWRAVEDLEADGKLARRRHGDGITDGIAPDRFRSSELSFLGGSGL
jgi:hypothetical protein